jgi:hypothetical protein
MVETVSPFQPFKKSILLLLHNLNRSTSIIIVKCLVKWDNRQRPPVYPFCRRRGKVDAAMTARLSEIVVPVSAVE